MTLTQRLVLVSLMTVTAIVFAFCGYVGVLMHHGRDFDLGSFCQWVSLFGLCVACTGVLFAILNAKE